MVNKPGIARVSVFSGSMLRLSRILAVAVAVLLAAELLVGALEPRLGAVPLWPTAEMSEIAVMLADRSPPETVALGSSVMGAALDPAALDARFDSDTFNAAFPWGSVDSQLLWFEALIRPLDVDRVFIEVSPLWLVSSPADISTSVAESIGYRNAVGESSRYDQLSLVRWRPVLSDPIRLASRLKYDGVVLADGQTGKCRPYGFNVELETRLLDGLAGIGEVDPPIKTAELFRLVDAVSAAGSTPILVVVPVSVDYMSLKPGLVSIWESGLDDVNRRAAADAIPVIDAGELVWPREFFVDPIHMNRNGAERFSAYVGHELARMSNPGLAPFADRTFDTYACGSGV